MNGTFSGTHMKNLQVTRKTQSMYLSHKIKTRDILSRDQTATMYFLFTVLLFQLLYSARSTADLAQESERTDPTDLLFSEE